MQQLVACPECQKQLRVPDNLLGTTVQCPECNHTFVAAAAGADASNDEPAAPPEEDHDPPRKSSSGSRRRVRDDDDDDDGDDIDVRKSRRGSRNGRKPDKVGTLGVLCLIGGILAIMLFLGWSGGSMGLCCLWPGTYYSLVVGIMAIIRGAGLMGASADQYPPPTGIAIMLIINIINFDIIGMVLGIVILNMCDDEVTDYLAK